MIIEAFLELINFDSGTKIRVKRNLLLSCI